MKPKRKFAKNRPGQHKDDGDDLKTTAMKTNSTLADDEDAKSENLLGGLGNSPSGKNALAAALYGNGDNVGE